MSDTLDKERVLIVLDDLVAHCLPRAMDTDYYHSAHLIAKTLAERVRAGELDSKEPAE